MKQEASMAFFLTLDMIGEYLTKALQRSRFCCFHNIIIGIREDDIPDYNASGRAFLEEQILKLNK